MSHELHHFSMGLWVFFLAYVISVAGSFVGLSCARKMVDSPRGRGRRLWLLLASLAIGGVAVWLMHFIGMMGFAVPGTFVRYDVGRTVLSAVLAVGATLFGLWLANLPALSNRRLPKAAALIAGGLVMGLAVTLMHYMGMAAIRIQGELTHDPAYVAASVVIGLVAATAALWFASVTGHPAVRVLAALVMGCAVVALHYTGMAGVHADVDPHAPAPQGVSVLTLLFPAFIIGVGVLAVPLAALLLAPDREESRRAEALARWTENSTEDPAENSGAPVA